MKIIKTKVYSGTFNTLNEAYNAVLDAIENFINNQTENTKKCDCKSKCKKCKCEEENFDDLEIPEKVKM